MGKLDNRVAIVTGGAQGIGRAIVDKLAEEGATVVVADLAIEPGQQLRWLRRLLVLDEPPSEDGHIRVEADEVESSAEREVDERDAPIGGVHRADEVQVLGQSERLTRIRQRDLALAVFE